MVFRTSYMKIYFFKLFFTFTFLLLPSFSFGQMKAVWVRPLMNADVETRNNTLNNVAAQWLNLDEAAARAWIAKSPLPEEMKKQLLERETEAVTPILLPPPPR